MIFLESDSARVWQGMAGSGRGRQGKEGEGKSIPGKTRYRLWVKACRRRGSEGVVRGEVRR